MFVIGTDVRSTGPFTGGGSSRVRRPRLPEGVGLGTSVLKLLLFLGVVNKNSLKFHRKGSGLRRRKIDTTGFR